MDPIEILMSEHRVIESVMDALEQYALLVERGGKADPDDLGLFVEFLREFADTCHHGKEEHILFEAMIDAGFGRNVGPVAVMLAEHEEGRAHVRTLREVALREVAWSEEDRRRVVEAARSFVFLLRNHIQKEDGILYPMALAHLSPEVIRDVGERFETFEEEKVGPGRHAALHTLAGDLEARYGKGQAPATCEHT